MAFAWMHLIGTGLNLLTIQYLCQIRHTTPTYSNQSELHHICITECGRRERARLRKVRTCWCTFVCPPSEHVAGICQQNSEKAKRKITLATRVPPNPYKNTQPVCVCLCYFMFCILHVQRCSGCWMQNSARVQIM